MDNRTPLEWLKDNYLEHFSSGGNVSKTPITDAALQWPMDASPDANTRVLRIAQASRSLETRCGELEEAVREAWLLIHPGDQEFAKKSSAVIAKIDRERAALKEKA